MKKAFLTLLILSLVSGFLLFSEGQEESANSSASLVNKTGFPLVNEEVTLDFMAVQHAWSRNWGDMPMFQQYEEQTGVKVNWTMIPQSDQKEKVNLLLAAGDYPDVIFSPGLAGRMGEAVADGIVMPLNDLIEKWAPNIQNMFVEQPQVRPSITYPDGEIYGFMRYHNTSHHQRTTDQWYINEKWLENLGLEMPETPDDLYEVLKAFKEGDPNGNGQTDDEIPLAFYTLGAGDIDRWITYFGAWGVTDTILIDKGQARWGFLDKGYKQALTYFRKLYSEGLLDLESVSQTRNQVKSKAEVDGTLMLGSGIALAPQFLWKSLDKIFYWDPSVSTAQYMEDLVINENREIWILPPMKGPEGHQLWRENVGGGMTAKDVAIMFKGASQPELITRWMDTWYDGAEMGQTMQLGPMGIRWYVDEETGHYMNIEPPEGMNKNEHRAQHCPGSGGFSVGYYDRYGKLTKPPYPEHLMLEMQTEVYLEYAPEESFPHAFIIPTLEEVDFLAQYEEEMMNYVWETMAKMIASPNIDMDAEWDNFVKTVERMKADEILKIKQAQYDRYKSNF